MTSTPSEQPHEGGEEGTHRKAHNQRSSFAVVYPEQVIGNYAVGDTIGQGSFGKVKKGRHLHTGELVAMKVLNRQKLKSANMDRKVSREIDILRLFSHPNICRLYEVISTPTDLYLIMEYVEGGELYDYIVHNGSVRESEARYIFQQVVCAIEYCHHFRIVHRDLKPENILLGVGLQVKLIDFGLSNVMKDGEFLTTSCGSPNYAAPEVISGKLYFGPEVDVWSCGVILFALLCGYLPFDEESIPLLFSKIKKGKYTIPNSVPAGARELIQQILVVDPLVRLTIPQIRDNAWFNHRLPTRLLYNESIFNTHDQRIISVLASETARRLNMPLRVVRRDIGRGSGPAYVAYSILLDAKRRKLIAAEVRELGMTEEAMGIAKVEQHTTFEPRAMERELNLGLMLTQSPAMEVLLDHADATSNKAAYNTGVYVPASAHDCRPMCMGSAEAHSSFGTFSMAHQRSSLTGKSGFGSYVGSSSTGVGSYPRTGMHTTTAATRLGVSLSDQPRIGSVARKHAMYTADEEQFVMENNYGWRIGLMTDLHAKKALVAIYEVLKEFDMEWKILSPFKLLARTTTRTWEAIHRMGEPCAADLTASSLRASDTLKQREVVDCSFPSASSPDRAHHDRSPDESRYPSGHIDGPTTPPASPVVLMIYLFRIHERHDRSYLVTFSTLRHTMMGMDVVLRLSDTLIQRIG